MPPNAPKVTRAERGDSKLQTSNQGNERKVGGSGSALVIQHARLG